MDRLKDLQSGESGDPIDTGGGGGDGVGAQPPAGQMLTTDGDGGGGGGGAVELKSSESTPELAEQLKLYDPIIQTIALTKRNTEQVRKLYDEQIRAASEADKQAIVKRMNAILQETQAAGLDMKRRLDTMAEDNRKHAREHPHASTTMIRFNLQAKHTRDFQTAIHDFQSVSDMFRKGLQDATRRQLKQIGLDDKKIEQVVQSGQAQEVIRQSISEDLSDVIDSIQQRHASILHLERSVREVQELFIDLAHLVDVQQEYLDNIETHIRQAKDYAEQGEKHLIAGAKHQDEARKRLCCIVIVVVILLVVVLSPILVKFVPS